MAVLTLGGIVVFVVALALIAVLPAPLGNLGLSATVKALLAWLRWPILFIFALIGRAGGLALSTHCLAGLS